MSPSGPRLIVGEVFSEEGTILSISPHELQDINCRLLPWVRPPFPPWVARQNGIPRRERMMRMTAPGIPPKVQMRMVARLIGISVPPSISVSPK